MSDPIPQNAVPFRCDQCDFSNWIPAGFKMNYCPGCGNPTKEFRQFLAEFFRRANLSKLYADSVRQFDKVEFQASVRSAMIVLEQAVKNASRLDSHGVDLMNKAFAFKTENSIIVEPPAIRINPLETPSEQSEQDGFRLFTMGIMKGIRNTIAHSNEFLAPMLCLSIIMMCNFALDVVENGSVLNERTCIWTRIKASDQT